MKILLCSIVLGLALVSCQQSEKTTSASPELGNRSKTMLYKFSDTLNADTFRVELQGTNSKNMNLKFSIRNHKGHLLYENQITAKELLKSYESSAKLKNEADKQKMLIEELNAFFDEEHLLEPALMPDDVPDKNVPDIKFYKELKVSGLNGFEYRLGKDSNYYIAWSNTEKKVKIYYKCC